MEVVCYCLLLAPVAFIASFIVYGILLIFCAITGAASDKAVNSFGLYLIWGCTALPVLIDLINLLRVMVVNGSKPAENSRRRMAFARRQNEYEEAVARAMRAAEPVKAAEDHRLRVQIRELEGEIKAVGEKAAAVRRDLAKL